MNKKGTSLMETIVTIIVISLVLLILRDLLGSVMYYRTEIKYNNDQLAKTQKILMYTANDLKTGYKVEIVADGMIIKTINERVYYKKLDGYLYRNNIQIMKLDNIQADFIDVSEEVNLLKGKRLIKVSLTFIRKTGSQIKPIILSQYTSTSELLP